MNQIATGFSLENLKTAFPVMNRVGRIGMNKFACRDDRFLFAVLNFFHCRWRRENKRIDKNADSESAATADYQANKSREDRLLHRYLPPYYKKR